MKKIYTYETVTFGSTGQKWSFTAPGFEFKTSLPGGRETAEKVARIVNGSLKRTKGAGLDNLGRTNIETIVNKVKAANHENFNLH